MMHAFHARTVAGYIRHPQATQHTEAREYLSQNAAQQQQQILQHQTLWRSSCCMPWCWCWQLRLWRRLRTTATRAATPPRVPSYVTADDASHRRSRSRSRCLYTEGPHLRRRHRPPRARRRRARRCQSFAAAARTRLSSRTTNHLLPVTYPTTTARLRLRFYGLLPFVITWPQYVSHGGQGCSRLVH
jgi:hypothetical protein